MTTKRKKEEKGKMSRRGRKPKAQPKKAAHIWSDGETPKSCRYCGKNRCTAYATRKLGPEDFKRIVRYRKCDDCGGKFITQEFQGLEKGKKQN